MAKTARDVMTKDVITVSPSTRLDDVARMFAEDRISGAPVVDATERLVGIVSRTDVITGLLEQSAETAAPALRTILGLAETDESEPEDGGDVPEPEAIQGMVVEDVMEGDPVTVTPATPLAAIARRMNRERIHRVVVMEDGRVAGILTSIDLLGQFPDGATGRPKARPGKKPAARAGAKTARKARKARRPARKVVRSRR
jgi:CBS domain-containing protein